jgi:hypothetical protein
VDKPDKVDKWESKHVVRAPDSLWTEFGEACADSGRTRSVVLRAYMRRYVAAWKGRQAKGDHDADSSE